MTSPTFAATVGRRSTRRATVQPLEVVVEVPGLDDAHEVLTFARQRRAVAQAADAELLVAATIWADLHPAESIHDAAWMVPDYLESPLTLAGPGAPLVAEFAVPELAAPLGMSTDAGRSLLGDALELKHRLPRHWARIIEGDLPAWKARKVAQRTKNLTTEAADHVDRHLAPFSHKVGLPTIERLCSEAIARFMPETAAREAADALDGRHVTFHHTQPGAGIGVSGTTFVEAELDAADARDLDQALTHGAAVLKAAGCEKSLDVRRAMAAGDLARAHTRDQLTLDLLADQLGTHLDSTDVTTVPASAHRPKARQVVLHVHLGADALTTRPSHDEPWSRQARPTKVGADESQQDRPADGADPLHLARVEEGRRIVTADQVRTWCTDPNTSVTVRPVIDLAHEHHVEAYEIPGRLRDQAILRDQTCVFPWCTRPARSADIDHVIPHSREPGGGKTSTDNLAPLCRRHHRLKTHAPWHYTVLTPATYLWSSPHGYQFLRDPGGTRDVTSGDPPARHRSD